MTMRLPFSEQEKLHGGAIRPRALLLTVSFLCLAGVALVSCEFQTSGGSEAPSGGSVTTSGPVGSPPVTVPPTMYATVKTEVARDMGLTAPQITAQLQADPHADLMTIGKGSGLAQDQLQRLLLAALNHASDQNVQNRAWTQQQAATDMGYWNRLSAGALIAEITDWFRTH